jgi:hypothetical protein
MGYLAHMNKIRNAYKTLVGILKWKRTLGRLRRIWKVTSKLDLIYSFIYSLFDEAFSISDYTASNERMIVNNVLERMWKEAIVA